MEVDPLDLNRRNPLPLSVQRRGPLPQKFNRDGNNSSMSATIDDDWDVSDWDSQDEMDDEEEDVDENQGTCRPFTVNEFPRLSSDHFVQTDTIYARQDLHRRGPAPLSLFCPLKDYVSEEGFSHWFGSQYHLFDESEISVNNVGTFNCSDICVCRPMELLQIIDLKIAGYQHAQPGRAKIFGFFAVRDRLEPLRNYVYRCQVDNYEAVSVKPKTGMACLSLTSPARCICISSRALFEFKLCIRTEDSCEDKHRDDILIEGCDEITNLFGIESFVKTGRFCGEKCGLDVTYAILNIAVQAIVDVEIVCSCVRS